MPEITERKLGWRALGLVATVCVFPGMMLLSAPPAEFEQEYNQRMQMVPYVAEDSMSALGMKSDLLRMLTQAGEAEQPIVGEARGDVAQFMLGSSQGRFFAVPFLVRSGTMTHLEDYVEGHLRIHAADWLVKAGHVTPEEAAISDKDWIVAACERGELAGLMLGEQRDIIQRSYQYLVRLESAEVRTVFRCLLADYGSFGSRDEQLARQAEPLAEVVVRGLESALVPAETADLLDGLIAGYSVTSLAVASRRQGQGMNDDLSPALEIYARHYLQQSPDKTAAIDRLQSHRSRLVAELAAEEVRQKSHLAGATPTPDPVTSFGVFRESGSLREEFVTMQLQYGIAVLDRVLKQAQGSVHTPQETTTP